MKIYAIYEYDDADEEHTFFGYLETEEEAERYIESFSEDWLLDYKELRLLDNRMNIKPDDINKVVYKQE